MEIIFTNAQGKGLQWDGMLWSSPDVPAVAARLNQELLGWGSRHCSILDRAQRQAKQFLGAVEMEVRDLTGMPEEHIGADVIFGEEGLADGAEGWEYSGDDDPAKTSSQGSTLDQAIALCRGGLWSDGSDDGQGESAGGDDDCDDDWDEPERQWSDLREWSAEQRMILPGAGPDRTGGREHDVRFDTQTQRWIKFTKPGLAGFMVDWKEDGTPYLLDALPEQYFARMRRQNDLLGDDVEFVGLWHDELRRAWRIVITQPDVPGEPPTQTEIQDGMKALGFVQMRWKGIGYEDSTSWRIGRFGVWDVHPANVILAENGMIVPIDVIITELPHGFPPCHFHPEAGKSFQRLTDHKDQSVSRRDGSPGSAG